MSREVLGLTASRWSTISWPRCWADFSTAVALYRCFDPVLYLDGALVHWVALPRLAGVPRSAWAPCTLYLHPSNSCIPSKQHLQRRLLNPRAQLSESLRSERSVKVIHASWHARVSESNRWYDAPHVEIRGRTSREIIWAFPSQLKHQLFAASEYGAQKET